ncbi:MAG: AtpZ/AtpI family protein [Sedimentisphaerales bacterium]|nr:AtpZ/AtpI family protein [Sedimentisphaerales bacterium]
MPDKKPIDKGLSKQNLRWLGAGIEFCVVVGIFSYIGFWLDRYFDCAPGMMIIGFLVGFIGMVYTFYKDANK